MNAQFPTAKSIFLAVIEKAPSERTAFIDQACAGDEQLCAQVARLLRSHEALGTFHEAAAVEQVSSRVLATIDQPLERVVNKIGPYKLLEQIGEGGMGLVYMAQQQRPMRRLVALKLIKPGMDSQACVARFEAERQALAMMDHPHIAKIFDAGTTGEGGRSQGSVVRTDTSNSSLTPDSCPQTPTSGRPYFVMELVRGIPLNEFCAQKGLSVRQRLELFSQVCQAVQHAHQKGIIHRDLKPTNVLVTLHDSVAVPKVIDFGIAKALGQSLTEKTLHTGFAQLVGTPLYMSPEQAEMNQLGVDTRSDVYSLGVMLYELLTGTTPFDKDRLKSAGFDEMRRIIREEEPETVSQRLARTKSSRHTPCAVANSPPPSPQPLAPRPSELDWIVMKSLEKDRTRRYESASALAADIQRYLTDEPVLACPPTTMYRFQKFARKHKPALVTLAAIAFCLLLGTTVSAWQAVRATTAETQAKANEAQAQASAQEAETKAQEATTQRDEAQRQRDEVKALADKLAAKEQQLQRSLYASNMTLAQHAWDAGGITRTNELLDQHRPKPGETDLRGFEWHYLYRLCHSELLTINGYTTTGPAPQSVAFSPDGKRLAGACGGPGNPVGQGEVKVWDAHTGKELLSLKGYSNYGPGVTFSPDGKRLAFGNRAWDDTKKTYGEVDVKVCDAHTGQELMSLKGHAGWVYCVVYSPDGKRLASGGGSYDEGKPGEVKVWDAETGVELFSLKGHTDAVHSIAYRPDGKRLASDSENGVRVWDAETGNELLSLKEGGNSLAFSPDGKRLASSRQVWDAETGQELLSLKNGGQGVAFSPDGKRLATASGDKTVRVWDSQTGDELLTFKGHTHGVGSVVFSPDGTRLASGAIDATIKVWDVTISQEPRSVSGRPIQVRSVSFRPDGKRVAFASAGTINIVDAQTRQEIIHLKGHPGGINSIAYSPDGKHLASASNDKTVKVWDAQTGQEVLTFTEHTGSVTSVAYSPDGKHLASASGDKTVKVWDAQTGRELFTFKGHAKKINSVAFSPDGKRLVTLSQDNIVKVWDVRSGHVFLTLNALAYMGGSVTFSPDGKRLASTHSNPFNLSLPAASGVKVWDAQTGAELFTGNGHSAQVNGLAFSPDSKRLLTGAGSYGPLSAGELKLWDAQTGQELITLDGRGGPSNDVAFSPDGYRLAGFGRDGALKIWNATPLAADADK